MNASAGVTKIHDRERCSIRRRLVRVGLAWSSPKRTPRIAAGTTVA